MQAAHPARNGFFAIEQLDGYNDAAYTVGAPR